METGKTDRVWYTNFDRPVRPDKKDSKNFV